MNKIYLAILLSSWALYGHAQPKAILAKPLQDSIKKDRIANIYANRKYSFSLSESLYGSLSHYHPFGVFDITFSDRLTWLDSLLKNASLEVNAGIGFEPFQGCVHEAPASRSRSAKTEAAISSQTLSSRAV